MKAGKCFRCKQTGHRLVDCPQPPDPQILATKAVPTVQLGSE
jgi:hypothetical protein